MLKTFYNFRVEGKRDREEYRTPYDAALAARATLLPGQDAEIKIIRVHEFEMDSIF